MLELGRGKRVFCCCCIAWTKEDFDIVGGLGDGCESGGGRRGCGRRAKSSSPSPCRRGCCAQAMPSPRSRPSPTSSKARVATRSSPRRRRRVAAHLRDGVARRLRRGLGGPTIGAVDHGGRRRRPRGDASPVVDARASEHAAWNRVMHNDPAGGVVRGAKTKMSVHARRQEGPETRGSSSGSARSSTCASSTTSPTTPSAPSSSSASTASSLSSPRWCRSAQAAEGPTAVAHRRRRDDPRLAARLRPFAGEEWCVSRGYAYTRTLRRRRTRWRCTTRRVRSSSGAQFRRGIRARAIRRAIF